MKIVHVVGARPNFMKVAPIMAARRSSEGVEQRLVHAGQSYDEVLFAFRATTQDPMTRSRSTSEGWDGGAGIRAAGAVVERYGRPTGIQAAVG